MTTLPTDPELTAMRRLIRSELRRFADHEDAEDIAQEAWIECWRQWQRLKGQYALSTVVRVCVRSALTSWVRSRKGRRQWRPAGRKPAPEWAFLEEVPEAEQPLAFDSPAAAMERIAALQMSERALGAMTARQAHMVRRTVMSERPYRLVAAEEGVDVKTVWQTVQNGLKNGRKVLECV